MTPFSLILHDGHAIIVSGSDRILIDTGSPKTIHTSTSLQFMDQTFSCSTGSMVVNSTSLSAMLGAPVTTLFGMDVMSKFKVLFDYRAGFISFSHQDIPTKGYQKPISQVMGIPIVELEVLGNTHKLFLDTGAKLSYLSQALTAELTSVGVETDFYPGHGPFQTPVFEVQSKITESNFTVKYGNLPVSLQSLLTMGNVQGIIGFDLFNTHQVMLDSQNQFVRVW